MAAAAATAAGISEDEAALYDRQIRLWGVEAQNRMRNASLLVITLRGIATEVIKNVVLAGVGRVHVLDPLKVEGRDLGAGFFYAEDDLGSLRVEAAKQRIEALNPRVKVTTSTALQDLDQDDFLNQFDLVVLTEAGAKEITKLNSLTRSLNKKFFASTSLGLSGYIFADLLTHSFLADKIVLSSSEGGQQVKTPTRFEREYVSFERLCEEKGHWKGRKERQVKKVQQSLWGVLTLFQHQLTSSSPPTSSSLLSLSSHYLPTLLASGSSLSSSLATSLSSSIGLEFSPSCAVLGGILGQDCLNVLGGKEEPVRNLLVLEGETGRADSWFLGGDGLEDGK